MNANSRVSDWRYPAAIFVKKRWCAWLWLVCGEYPIAILEAGWATVAVEFGERASEANQARHYAELRDWATRASITVFFFEAFDEPWKGDPSNVDGAEKHWGIFNVDRTPKQVMQ